MRGKTIYIFPRRFRGPRKEHVFDLVVRMWDGLSTLHIGTLGFKS